MSEVVSQGESAHYQAQDNWLNIFHQRPAIYLVLADQPSLQPSFRTMMSQDVSPRPVGRWVGTILLTTPRYRDPDIRYPCVAMACTLSTTAKLKAISQ